MAPKPRFNDGEKVLCFHGPLLYEAKCLKSQIKEKHMEYFIHYSGWNKNWDEWVPECRVLKYNEANLQKQKELAKTHTKAKKSKPAKIVIKKEPEKETAPLPPPDKTPKQKSSEKRAASTPIFELCPQQIEAKKSKMKIEPSFVEEETPVKTDARIDLPPILQTWLADDCDLVTRQEKLLRLPARITVDHILANYVREKVGTKTLPPNVENTIVQGANKIRDCFNVLLGRFMLHKFERPQYREVLAEYSELKMCQIYGAPHLLRMFSTIGDMLVSISPPGTDLSKLMNHLEDFIKYLAANELFFSLNDYVTASSEYHRRAL